MPNSGGESSWRSDHLTSPRWSRSLPRFVFAAWTKKLFSLQTFLLLSAGSSFIYLFFACRSFEQTRVHMHSSDVIILSAGTHPLYVFTVLWGESVIPPAGSKTCFTSVCTLFRMRMASTDRCVHTCVSFALAASWRALDRLPASSACWPMIGFQWWEGALNRRRGAH